MNASKPGLAYEYSKSQPWGKYQVVQGYLWPLILLLHLMSPRANIYIQNDDHRGGGWATDIPKPASNLHIPLQTGRTHGIDHAAASRSDKQGLNTTTFVVDPSSSYWK